MLQPRLWFLLLFAFLCAGPWVPAGPRRQGTDDFESRWRRCLVYGLGAEQEQQSFLQELATRFGIAGDTLSQVSEHACAVIPFLARQGALMWPESPAGASLNDYVRLAAPKLQSTEQGLKKLASSMEPAVDRAGMRAGADEQQVSAYMSDVEGVALLARYHARKIAAARALALFEQSGDLTALHSAMSSARAALSLWERLPALVRQRPGLLFTTELSEYCTSGVRRAHGDLRIVEEAESVFRRYGLFDAALSFGPKDSDGSTDPSPVRWPQGRFRHLYSETSYTRQRGFGWVDAASVRSCDGAGLKGNAAAILAIDLPDGDYRVTSLVFNQPEIASGSFQIVAGPDAISYQAGETGEKSMETRSAGSRLEIRFVPGSGGDWLVCGLVIARRAPHFGIIPLQGVESGTRTFLAATITAPDGITEATLSCMAAGQRASLPLMGDGAQFFADILWPRRLKGQQVRCRFSATDGKGTSARFPPASDDFIIPVR